MGVLMGSFKSSASRTVREEVFDDGAERESRNERERADHHDGADHADHKDEGNDAAITRLLVRVHRWHAAQIATLATKLDAIAEGEGTMLGCTILRAMGEDVAGFGDAADCGPLSRVLA